MPAPFDTAAASYDQEFDQLPATARIRTIVMNQALSLFPPGGSILELNCGTGTDAVTLARNGYTVLATDESGAMIRQSKEKVARAGVSSLVQLRQLSFDRLLELSPAGFHAAFSNMGGLNCAADLTSVAAVLQSLVRPGGLFLGVFLSRVSLWEILSFSLRGQFSSAFRRWAPDGVDVLIRDGMVKVYFYSPSEVEKAFAPAFKRVRLLGLNIVTPPPSATRAFRSLRSVHPFLERVEEAVCPLPPFNRIGDHFLIVMERGGE